MKHLAAPLAAFVLLCAQAPTAPPPTVTKAEDGIFAAFRTHPLVGIREAHSLAQELDFYSALIRDPRFPTQVGNVVMELGDAAYQGTIDRFVNGDYVPYAELRKVWADTVGWSPTMDVLGSINVYATIRDVNLALPPGRRIKVWLGDPPADWSKIKTKADLAPLEAQRNSFPAALIEREILAKGRKALVIYGAQHLLYHPTDDQNNLLALVSRAHPDAFFLVMPYPGYNTADCAARIENHFKDFSTPILVTPVRGTAWEADIWQPGCTPVPRAANTTAEAFDSILREHMVMTDALLYLGPASSLVKSPEDLDIYLDLDFRAEINRRQLIRNGRPLTGNDARGNPAVRPRF
jgi:hypothetical protein